MDLSGYRALRREVFLGFVLLQEKSDSLARIALGIMKNLQSRHLAKS